MKSFRPENKQARNVERQVHEDAAKIARRYKLIDQTKQSREFPLTAIEPYVVAAIASLLNFTSTQTERAEFLSALKSKYPQPSSENGYLNPGIINFYYQ